MDTAISLTDSEQQSSLLGSWMGSLLELGHRIFVLLVDFCGDMCELLVLLFCDTLGAIKPTVLFIISSFP